MTFVPILVASTFAPTTTRPLGSVTFPLTVAEPVCPKVIAENPIAMKAADPIFLHAGSISPPGISTSNARNPDNHNTSLRVPTNSRPRSSCPSVRGVPGSPLFAISPGRPDCACGGHAEPERVAVVFHCPVNRVAPNPSLLVSVATRSFFVRLGPRSVTGWMASVSPCQEPPAYSVRIWFPARATLVIADRN